MANQSLTPCLTSEDLLTIPERRRHRYIDDAGTTQEMYLPYLDGLQVTWGDVVLHCKRVFEEVCSKTFRNDGLFTTFNSTLNGQALTEWQAVYNALPEGTALDLTQLEQSIQPLIVAFAVEADRHALLQYLRQGSKKPKWIMVQVLVTLFQQLNGVADWLPSHMSLLTAEELKEAYHDRMPSPWIERLAATGHTVPGESMNTLRAYFTQQETLAKWIEGANNARQSRSALRRRRRDDAADEQHPEQQPRHRCRSCHRRDDRCTPAQGQRQAQAPEARCDNAAGRATGLCIADNAPCPVHPGAGHKWGKCSENARNRANNNNNHSNAQGAGGGQRHGRQQPQQRGEAQGHFVETIDSTMEQEDVSELPGGPREVSDPAPMVLDEEEQLIVDEPAPRVAAAQSFPAFSLTAASPPSVDSTGRPTLVHRTKPSQWGASHVPPVQATPLPLQSPWGHYKPPSKQTEPRKETPKPSAAAVKRAPPVAAPQPPPRDETPAPPETGNGEYLLPVFYVAPFGTAVVMQETHHLELFSFTDLFLEHSLDPSRISMRSTMFPSTALPQPINGPIPSYQTITTRSCASSGSAPTYASANEELKWPEASLLNRTVCTGKPVTATMSQSGSTSYKSLSGSPP